MQKLLDERLRSVAVLEAAVHQYLVLEMVDQKRRSPMNFLKMNEPFFQIPVTKQALLRTRCPQQDKKNLLCSGIFFTG